jgi:hypothetical protein
MPMSPYIAKKKTTVRKKQRWTNTTPDTKMPEANTTK